MELSITVKCNTCGRELETASGVRGRETIIDVTPCENCSENVYKTGEKDGHMKGRDEGRYEGLDEGYKKGYSEAKSEAAQ